MKKEYIITFCISFLIIATVVVISLMMLIPQQTTVTENAVEKYSTITKSEYEFKENNSLTFESLTREYTITSDQLAAFKSKKQYAVGNSDPFTAHASGNATSNNTSGTANSNNNTTSTEDKITNSNGGVKNPASTGK